MGGRPDREQSFDGVVAHLSSDTTQYGPGGNVQRVQPAPHFPGYRNANAPGSALHDEYVALKPDPVGDLRQQRTRRCQDPSGVQVGPYVCGKRAAVDDDGYRRAEWE